MNNKTSAFKILSPLQDFFRTESSSGIILLAATILALVIANSPLAELYNGFFSSYFTVGASALTISKPLILWINDGLMAIFFLLIGLEIKREVLNGELSDFRSALMPIVAAIGGAIVPGLIFFYFNQGTEFASGWAIAIATDIAFAIGILALLGSRVPLWAKVFLTAVAVVDDLIAVLVIAFFYTASIKTGALIVAGVCLVLLIVFNRMNIHRLAPYLIVGVVMWVAFLKSGVHATIAGVLLGLVIPASRPAGLSEVLEKIKAASSILEKAEGEGDKESRETAIGYIEEVAENAESPLYHLEHKLHPWVAYGIIPVFAFANAGVAINAEILSEALSSSLTWGIILGLFVGKQVGISLSVFLLDKLGLGSLSKEKGTAKIVYGLACLSGVGFTMSLFISGLSFDNSLFLEYSKVGIIIGSLLSGVLGYTILRSAIR